MKTHKQMFDQLEGGVFFARELDHILARTWEVKYADLIYRDLFPVSFEANPGAKTITYQVFDQVGKAAIIADYAQDLPRCDVSGKEVTKKIQTLGTSFAYYYKEMLSARMAGLPLEQRRANAARRAIEECMNHIVWFGDADAELPGLLDNTDIPSDTVATGVGGFTWAEKTPDEILLDLNTAFGTMFNDTLKVHRATKVLVPVLQWNYLFSTPRAAGSDMTIGSWIVANSPFLSSPADIIPVNELDGAGEDDADLFVIYNPSPENLQIHIPQDITFHDPQDNVLAKVINVTAEFGGLHIYHPTSIAFWDGI